MIPSQKFKNDVLDCLEDTLFATAHEIGDMLVSKLQRRPHIESIRKTLIVLIEEGVVERRHIGGTGGGYKNTYRLARTKPIFGSLRKAA